MARNYDRDIVECARLSALKLHGSEIMDEHAQFGAAPLKQEGFIYKYDGREGVFGYMSEGSKFIASILIDMPWYMKPFKKYFREKMISVWMEALLTAGGKNGRTH